jgi:hypothetical protein
MRDRSSRGQAVTIGDGIAAAAGVVCGALVLLYLMQRIG